MNQLKTTYLGLQLDNPLLPSSSPLTGELDSARQLEDAGAAGIVMPSLFEEAIHDEQKQLERFVHFQSIGHLEAESYQPVPDDYHSKLDNYLEKIQQLKSALNIPVIASLNGISRSGWIEHGKDLQQAGADALELNVYYVAADPNITGAEVEKRYTDLLDELHTQVDIPITMKLSSQFSSVANMVKNIEQHGAHGVVMFNRFYQPDIDLETLHIKPQIELSSSTEALLRVRWIALIRSRVGLSLAATGGFNCVDDIIKALLAGADAVYLCSVLLNHGPAYLATLKQQLIDWLEQHEYDSIHQMQGSVSQSCATNPAAYEHANYINVIDSYSPSTGVNR